MTARFITLEGGEGAGKSTSLAVIAGFLEARGIAHLVTREPGGTALGEAVRALLLGEAEQGVDPLAELLLIFAARAQHLAQVIRPALATGVWVVCDRFTDASYAYQGAGRQLGDAPVAALEQLVHGELHPDLTLILDLDPRVGLARIGGRGPLDRFEREQLAFFERVRVEYRQRATADPGRCRLIDAERAPEQVGQAVIAQLERLAIAHGC
ncbi:MAG TPA: dTMP kinase [Porticoccaceae bacterium]|nr:dTMP kinase [Porticoccaceae bacterium]